MARSTSLALNLSEETDVSNTLRSINRVCWSRDKSPKHARRDRNSGVSNAPRPFRQNLNRRFRFRSKSELLRHLTNFSLDDLSSTRFVRNANWNWF